MDPVHQTVPAGVPRHKRSKIRATFFVLCGLLLIWISTLVLAALVRSWGSVTWFFKLLLLLTCPGFGLGGVVLTLSPWSHIQFVVRAIKLVTAPIELLLAFMESVQILLWAFIVFNIVYVIPMVGWRVLELTGWAPIVPEKAYTYGSLVLASVVFTHWGATITARTTLKKRRERFTKVFDLLRPNSIRVVMYGLMAIVYAAANLEKFSGMTFTHANWWGVYKDVVVEVLLTYAAIDAVLVAWKDRKDSGID